MILSTSRFSRRSLLAAGAVAALGTAVVNAQSSLDGIPEGPLRAHVRWFIETLNNAGHELTSNEIESHFSTTFLQQIPPDQVISTITQLQDILGVVEAGRIAKASNEMQAGVQLIGDTGVSVLLTIWIDSETTLIDGLVIEPDASAVEAASTPVFDPATFDVGLELVADGFAQPLFVTDAGDGRLFVVEKGGTIRIINGDDVLKTPFLDITARVTSDGNEQGLLGLAFAPDYAESGLFYANYIDRAGNTMVSRFSVSDDPNIADSGSEQMILRQEQPYVNHNGGMLAFGPDNFLYIGFGDGGSGGDPHGNAQRLDTWLGKILRIEVAPAYVPEGDAYGVPDDNPFVGDEDALPEIWAYGLRNPWRFSFDSATGDMWIGDVGQGEIEEIDYLPIGLEPGQNLGWNVTEGTACYLDEGCDTSAFLLPVLEYTHDEGGCSVTGGYVYRGEDVPGLVGTYLFGDYCSGLLWGGGRDANGDWAKSAPIETGFGISSFGEDRAGNIYVTDLNGGGVYRIAPAL